MNYLCLGVRKCCSAPCSLWCVVRGRGVFELRKQILILFFVYLLLFNNVLLRIYKIDVFI